MSAGIRARLAASAYSVRQRHWLLWSRHPPRWGRGGAGSNGLMDTGENATVQLLKPLSSAAPAPALHPGSGGTALPAPCSWRTLRHERGSVLDLSAPLLGLFFSDLLTQLPRPVSSPAPTPVLCFSPSHSPCLCSLVSLK